MADYRQCPCGAEWQAWVTDCSDCGRGFDDVSTPDVDGGHESILASTPSERPVTTNLNELQRAFGGGDIRLSTFLMIFLPALGAFFLFMALVTDEDNEESAVDQLNRERPTSTAPRPTTTAPPSTLSTTGCNENNPAEVDVMAILFDSDKVPDPSTSRATYSVNLDGGVAVAYDNGVPYIFLFIGETHDEWQRDAWAINGQALNAMDSVIFNVQDPRSGTPEISAEDARSAIDQCLPSFGGS